MIKSQLAAQMGNPAFDPHGDPIPSKSGHLPQKQGMPISDLSEGEFGHIIHLEDELNAVYCQLLAMGLYPGMQVRMINSSQGRIIFEANSEEKD